MVQRVYRALTNPSELGRFANGKNNRDTGFERRDSTFFRIVVGPKAHSFATTLREYNQQRTGIAMIVRKKALVHSLILVSSIVVGILICEVVIRAYSYFYFPVMMKIDPVLGWSHFPNVQKVFENSDGEKHLVVQNKLGHRGPDYDYNVKNKDKRLLVLGDSFTEGVHVGEKDLFTSILESKNNLEVVNAGVGSYGTVQQYMYLRDRGLKYNLDIVLLMYFGNDLTDNCLSFSPGIGARPYAVVQNGEMDIIEDLNYEEYGKFSLPIPFISTLNKHSYFYKFMNTRVYQTLFAKSLLVAFKSHLKSFGDTCPKYEVFFHLLDRISALAKSRQIHFALALIPTDSEISTGVSESQVPIMKYCAEKGIPCLQLLDAMKAGQDQGAKPYFNANIHWTKGGHRIAAREIETFLRLQFGVR